jgi:hypothetical protein
MACAVGSFTELMASPGLAGSLLWEHPPLALHGSLAASYCGWLGKHPRLDATTLTTSLYINPHTAHK